MDMGMEHQDMDIMRMMNNNYLVSITLILKLRS